MYIYTYIHLMFKLNLPKFYGKSRIRKVHLICLTHLLRVMDFHPELDNLRLFLFAVNANWCVYILISLVP